MHLDRKPNQEQDSTPKELSVTRRGLIKTAGLAAAGLATIGAVGVVQRAYQQKHEQQEAEAEKSFPEDKGKIIGKRPARASGFEHGGYLTVEMKDGRKIEGAFNPKTYAAYNIGDQVRFIYDPRDKNKPKLHSIIEKAQN